MDSDFTVHVPAMNYVGDAPVYGPERRFVVYMIYQAVLDARAIYRRDAGWFKELAMHRKAKSAKHGKMWVIEQANRSLRKWLVCDQFAWYCELLHWDTDRVRITILGIIDGHSYEELKEHLIQMGGIARQEINNGIATRLQQTALRPVRDTERNNQGVQSPMWRRSANERDVLQKSARRA